MFSNSKRNTVYLYILVLLIYLTIILCINKILLLDEIVVRELKSNLKGIDLVNATQQYYKFSWVNYLVTPFLITLRVVLVSVCLMIGAFFYKLKETINFVKVLKVAIIAESAYIISETLKFFILANSQSTLTLRDIKYYRPLSILNFFDIEHLQEWKIVLLENVDFFRILYVFILVWGLVKVLKISYRKSFVITIVFYGGGLLIWTLGYASLLFYKA